MALIVCVWSGLTFPEFGNVQVRLPLPHIDTCLGSMDGAAWFSTLDLRSGYHNIPTREADRDKTAFVTRRGCFRYKVMPLGLTCAPSVFQRLMDLVLCRYTYETCLVYLDDIIVFSRDFDDHVARLSAGGVRATSGSRLKTEEVLPVPATCRFLGPRGVRKWNRGAS